MRMVAVWIIVIGFLTMVLGFDSLILWIYGVDGGVCPEGVTGPECTYKVVWLHDRRIRA